MLIISFRALTEANVFMRGDFAMEERTAGELALVFLFLCSRCATYRENGYQ